MIHTAMVIAISVMNLPAPLIASERESNTGGGKLIIFTTLRVQTQNKIIQ